MLRRSISLLAAPLVLAAGPAWAQWVPRQPIKILVGYPPGGTADIAARIAADTLQRQHGYTVIVDNKTGAGGFIALKAVAQSPPDGYTVGIGIMGQLAVGPVVPGSQIPLDLDKELVPICNLVGVPMALIVRMDAPFKPLELIAYAKANPGKVATPRPAWIANPLSTNCWPPKTGGLKMIHVPYLAQARRPLPMSRRRRRSLLRQCVGDHRRGAQQQGARAGAGVQQALTAGAGTAAAHQGHTGARHQQLVRPCPARTYPEDIKASLAKMFSMRSQIPRRSGNARRAECFEPLGQGPAAFAAYITKDRERWAKVVKQGNIKAE